MAASRLRRNRSGAVVVVLAEADVLGDVTVVGVMVGNNFQAGGLRVGWLGERTERQRLTKTQTRWLELETRYSNPRNTELS